MLVLWGLVLGSRCSMTINGMQKLTLLDYPGNVACLIFTQGCNFRCPFCHNSGLLDMNNNCEK